MRAGFAAWDALVVAIALLGSIARAEPIAIERLERTTPVDFATEIQPILRANCLACHNSTKAESELNLETPAAMLKGGANGAAIVAKNSAQSLLLKVAAHEEKKFMPPADNQVGARALTSRELGLLKLWIDQGAAGGASAPRNVQFRPLPANVAPIFATAVTRDGQYAACSRGNQIHVYHLPTKQLVARLVDPAVNAAHADVVRALAFDPAGQRLASGGFREVKLWRLPHVDALAQVKFDGAITSLAVSSDEKTAAIGRANGRVRLVEAATGKELRVLDGHQGAVTAIAFVDDKTLASVSRDKSLRIWSTEGGEPQLTLATPSEINALLAFGDGKQLVTAHDDGVVRILDRTAMPADGEAAKPVHEIRVSDQPLKALARWPQGTDEFLAAGDDGAVRLVSATASEPSKRWHHESPVVAVAVRGDGLRFATAGADRVRLWNSENNEPVADLRGDPRAIAVVARLEADIAFAKSAIDHAKNDIKSYEGVERRVMTTEEAIKKAETEEVTKAEKNLKEKQDALAKAKAEGKNEKELEQPQKELAEAQTAVSVAKTIVERAKVVAERAKKDFADAQAAVAAQEAKLKEIEAQKTAAEQTAAAPAKPVRSIAFTGDGQRLIVAGDDHIVKHYDSASGKPLTMSTEPAALATVAITASGLQLTGDGDGMLRIERIVSGWTLERTIGGQEANALTDRVLAIDFNRDGTLLATGGGLSSRGGELKMFKVAEGALVREIADAHADTVFGVRFSPDGNYLASAGADRLVKVFTVAGGDLEKTFAGHTAHVLGVSWSGDGRRLVSCGTDKVLKLWDFELGQPLFTMKGTTYQIGVYRGEVASAAFIGQSEQILAGSGDGTVRLHRASSENDIMTFENDGPKSYIYSVAASDDGRALIAGGADGQLRLWSQQERSLQAKFPPPESRP
jgi:WD40 repeat protein